MMTLPVTNKVLSLSYRNKKDKEVQLTITRHAQRQFYERWEKIFPDKPLDPQKVDDKIIEWFSHSQKVTTVSKHVKSRRKKYGQGTLYFRTNGFTFVVSDAKIVTIEISDKYMRHLNKIR